MKNYFRYVIFPFLSYWIAEIYDQLAQLGVFSFDKMLYKGPTVNSLLVYSPIAIALTSLIFGIRHGFTWILPIWIALLWLPYVFYINFVYGAGGAEVYTLPYALISLVFVLIGSLLRKMPTYLPKK